MKPSLFTWLRRSSGNGKNSLTIFNFHNVLNHPLPVPDLSFMSVNTFRILLDAIVRSYTILPLGEGIDRLIGGRIRGPAAAVTFDDGLENFSTVVFPIVSAKRIPVACFLVTGMAETGGTIWYCRLHHAISATKTRELQWSGVSFDLSSVENRAKVSIALQGLLKSLPMLRLEPAVDTIVALLGMDPTAPLSSDSPFRFMEQSRIREIANSGLVEFGAHTHSHAILSLLTPEEQKEEIAGSIRTVRELTGQKADIFAYPNGRREDYNADTIAILRGNGVRAALTTERGRCGRHTPLMEMPRIWLSPETRAEEIAP